VSVIKKESITIRVNPRFKQKLEKIAEHNKRTLSDYIRVELENIVEHEEKEGILKDFMKKAEKQT
jgi:predicted transcriptional regulator